MNKSTHSEEIEIEPVEVHLQNRIDKLEGKLILWKIAFWFTACLWVTSWLLSFPKREVEIQEGDATRLFVRDMRPFSSSDSYVVEARKNPDEDYAIQWARKEPDGSYFFINAESLYRDDP